jgi:hypothetical protein
MKDESLAIRLPAALARALARAARARGLSRSEVVREALAAYIAPARPPASPASRLAAKELAVAWATVPRLGPGEAEALARDIDRGRENLVLPDERWE